MLFLERIIDMMSFYDIILGVLMHCNIPIVNEMFPI